MNPDALPNDGFSSHTFSGIPALVQFLPRDRANVTESDIARLQKFGFIVVFSDYTPKMIGESSVEEAT